MLNSNLLLSLRLVSYSALILTSFVIFVGIAVMTKKVDFSDYSKTVSCPLYFDYDKHGIYPGPESNCSFPMATSIIFQLVFLLFRVITLLLLLLGKIAHQNALFSNFAEFVYVIIDLSGFFLTLVGACILYFGMKYTCKKSRDTYRLCDQDELEDAVAASKVPETGAWISTALWFFIAVCGAITCWRAGIISCTGRVRGDAFQHEPQPDPRLPQVNNPGGPEKY